MEKKQKRYCIEKLIDFDQKQGLETWKRTKWCDDKTDILETMFLAANHRIYDTHEQKEVKRNVDIQEWIIFQKKNK